MNVLTRKQTTIKIRKIETPKTKTNKDVLVIQISEDARSETPDSTDPIKLEPAVATETDEISIDETKMSESEIDPLDISDSYLEQTEEKETPMDEPDVTNVEPDAPETSEPSLQTQTEPGNAERDHFYCKHCELSFETKTDYHNHCLTLEHHKKRFSVQLSLEKLENEEDLQPNDTPRLCERCGEVFPTLSDWCVHLCKDKAKRRNNPTSVQTWDASKALKHSQGKPHHCSFCGKGFATKKYRIIHERIHTGERPYICDVCKKGFYDRSLCNAHTAMHFNEKPHKCMFCDKGFWSKSHLTIHERKHTGEKPFKCEHCERGFNQKSLLRTHVMAKHLNQRPFKCRFCDRRFPLKGSMVVHEMRHTGERPYMCNECGEGFVLSKDLKMHALVKHVQDKPYKCSYCEKSFPSKQQVDVHETHHTGKKLFTCDLCKMGFSYKCTLKNHYLRTHLIEMEEGQKSGV